MENLVKFRSTTQAKYDALVTKDSKSLYFTTDTHRIYKGGELFSISDVSNLATKDDATLTRESIVDSVWEFSPATYNDIPIEMSISENAGVYSLTPTVGGEAAGLPKPYVGDTNSVVWGAISSGSPEWAG